MTVYFKSNCYEFQVNICLGLNIAFLAKVHVNEFCFRWGMLINLLHFKFEIFFTRKKIGGSEIFIQIKNLSFEWKPYCKISHGFAYARVYLSIYLQSTLVISTSVISNNRLSR